jgi:hypothetical protein
MNPALEHARDEISDHMDAIVALFKPGVKITVLVRTPSHPDGSRDLLMTSDTIGAIVKALRHREPMTDTGEVQENVLEKVAKWMIRNGLPTGHGDTLDDLLGELEFEIKRQRETISALKARE